MTEPQLTNSEKEMLLGAPEEKIIFRLKCIHHKVCGYMCTPVCPHRATTSAEQVLEERVKVLETKVSELYRAIKQLHRDTAGDRKIGGAELRSQRGREPGEKGEVHLP